MNILFIQSICRFRLVYKKTIIQEDNYYLPYVWECLRWPDQHYVGEEYNITMFTVTDKSQNAWTRVNAGGVGFNFVHIYLESQVDCRYEFDIVIYGFRIKKNSTTSV